MKLFEDKYGNCHDAILYCFSFDCISSLDKPVYILIFTVNSFDSHLLSPCHRPITSRSYLPFNRCLRLQHPVLNPIDD